MRTVNVHLAETHLSRLIEVAQSTIEGVTLFTWDSHVAAHPGPIRYLD